MSSVAALGIVQSALHMKRISANRSSPKMQTMNIESSEPIGAQASFWNCWNSFAICGSCLDFCQL